MILVDTSVWIDFLKGEKSIHHQTLHRLIEGEEDVCLTEIIITEILQGIKSDGNFRIIKDYLLEFPIYSPKGIDTYLKAAEIYRNCRKRGKTVRKTVDCIIAAICIENNLVLFHNDRDFDAIEECAALKVLKTG
ncbi:MAG: PIN domain nuclease [Candidatus Omnitrophica bacterium]|nr:PIN domain nuclease [Candidatus Omnitrophota bacterium]